MEKPKNKNQLLLRIGVSTALGVCLIILLEGIRTLDPILVFFSISFGVAGLLVDSVGQEIYEDD